MSEAMVQFTFEGRTYRVGVEVHDMRCLIGLPDGRALRVFGWTQPKDGPPTPTLVAVANTTIIHAVEVVEDRTP